MSARLASIWRYPIKGFGAQELESADLKPGQGIPFDRCLAILNHTNANNEHGVPNGTDWMPCQNFVRLTKNPNLPSFTMRFDPECALATLTGPDDRTIKMALGNQLADKAEDDALMAWFATNLVSRLEPVTRAQPEAQGWWDHEDAALSLINPATVALLERYAGEPIDPMRFRGNLLIRDMKPFEELALIGRRVRIGDVILEFLRPIDRCRATSIDPKTGNSSLNVPALLARNFGHIFCGVYARVVRGGRIQPDDVIEDIGCAKDAIRDGTLTNTAPPVADWPRFALVEENVEESTNVVSLWLNDPLAPFQCKIKTGQHIRVHLLDANGEPLWRAYTVSGIDEKRLRISVKRDGVVSSLLHRIGLGQGLMISGPFGDFHLTENLDDVPLIFLSAGIGITPMVAMLRQLTLSRTTRPVFVIHTARSLDELALWQEILELINQLPGAAVALYLTQADATECNAIGAYTGRIPFDRAFDNISWIKEAQAYLCGPANFMADANRALTQIGVKPEQIYSEIFISPRTHIPDYEQLENEVAQGPFRVLFVDSGQVAIWTPKAGTLLDLAESVGLTPLANCRAGVCGTCRTRLLSGTVKHYREPIMPSGSDIVYLCCSTPASDIDLS